MANLIYNAIRTPDGTVINSRHRHDYKTYLDANGETYMVDGGLSYLRRNICSEPYEELSLYDTEPHEVQRTVLTWGTYGINGDQPYKEILIADMETEHLQAVIDNVNPVGVYGDCIRKELEQRLS